VATITGTSSDTPLAIPDNDPAGVSSTITIADGGLISGVTVTFDITHTYVSSLYLYLARDGVEVLLGQGSQGPQPVNGVNSYSFSPTAFDGDSANADWTLRVVDPDAYDDSGELLTWSIEITTTSDYGLVFVDVTASGSGEAFPYGEGSPEVAVSAAGAGFFLGEGALFLPVTASGLGGIKEIGTGTAELQVSAAGRGLIDWVSALDPIQLQEVYRLTVTGGPDSLPDLIIGKISSWQATNQAGERSSYVQAVIPAAQPLLADLQARTSGELVIEKGYRFSDGTERYEEVIRSRFDDFRYDRGGSSLTATVSGYLTGKTPAKAVRTLTGVRSISLTQGKYRVRCDVDLFLQPGMTVNAADVSFTADYINYYVSDVDKFCEVSER